MARVFSSPPATLPTSDSLTGAWLRQAITSVRYCSGLVIWSFAPSAAACRGPSNPPLAPFTLAAAIAVRTSSIDSP